MTDAVAATPGTPSTLDDGARQRRAPSLASGLVVLSACVPSLVAAASVAGQAWMPSFDQALEMLRIADVGGPHSPMVGVFSRWGWAHPGPMLFYALAPFYRLGGPTGVLVGTALVNASSVGCAVAGAVLAGGRRLGGVAAVVLGLLSLGLGLDRLVDPWNPHLALLPWTAFVVLAWAACLGRPWLLVPAVVLASFSLQAHVGYSLLVLGPLGLSVGVVVWRMREGRTRPLVMPLGAAVVAGMVCWAAPLWEQLTVDPGNLELIARYGRRPSGETAGLTVALGSLGAHVRLLGPWLTGDDVNGLNFGVTGALAPAIVVLTATALLSLRARRHRPAGGHGVLLAMVGLAVLIALVTSARVSGLYAPYIVLYWRGVGALAVLALGWAMLGLAELPTRAPRAAIATLLVALLGAAAVAELPADVPLSEVSDSLAALIPDVESALVPEATYLVRGQDLRQLSAPISGLFWALERRGHDVRVDPDTLSPLTYGSWRTATPGQVDGVLFVVDRTSIDLGWLPPEGSRLVAIHDPLTTAERLEQERLEARIRVAAAADPQQPLYVFPPYFGDLLVRAGARRADVIRLAELHARGDAYEVHLLPAA